MQAHTLQPTRQNILHSLKGGLLHVKTALVKHLLGVPTTANCSVHKHCTADVVVQCICEFWRNHTPRHGLPCSCQALNLELDHYQHWREDEHYHHYSRTCSCQQPVAEMPAHCEFGPVHPAIKCCILSHSKQPLCMGRLSVWIAPTSYLNCRAAMFVCTAVHAFLITDEHMQGQVLCQCDTT